MSRSSKTKKRKKLLPGVLKCKNLKGRKTYKKFLKNFIKQRKRNYFKTHEENSLMEDLECFHKLLYKRFFGHMCSHSDRSPWKFRKNHTIRINRIPFTEAALIHAMAIVGRSNGIDLKIVDVPWSETYRALVNDKIDIALHDKAIDTAQRPLVPGKLPQLKLLRTDKPLYTYIGYNVIKRKKKGWKKTGKTSTKRIAVIGNSEHNDVCKEYNNRHKGRQLIPYPVDGVSECFETLFKGKADACIVGGHERDFAKKYLRCKGVVKFYTEDKLATGVYFWALQTSQEENWKTTEIIDLWNITQKILNDDARALEEMGDEILCRLNRDRDIAFFEKFKKLQRVLSEHKKPFTNGKLYQSCNKMVDPP